MQIKKWNEAEFGRMTTDKIRSLYKPENRFFVRWNKYESEAEFSGASAARVFYLLRGSCEVKIADEIFHIRAGEYVDLPKGEYDFKVIGNVPVELVSVWELPERFG